MSRGFVKEGDQEDIPIIPQRAPLPYGVANHVTANGLKELEREQHLLIEQQKSLIEQSSEINRVEINYIKGKLTLLEDRINSARVVDLSTQPQNEIHFGATITLSQENEEYKAKYQIVGVDEADVSQNKISFLSPIAKELRNKKVGDIIELQTPLGKRYMKIEVIEY